MNSVTTLMTSHNTEGQLTGSIPASLGNLVNLKNLTLNQNNLEGDIPVELGKLVNLEQLLLRTVFSHLHPLATNAVAMKEAAAQYGDLCPNLVATMHSFFALLFTLSVSYHSSALRVAALKVRTSWETHQRKSKRSRSLRPTANKPVASPHHCHHGDG
jgi:hypothetical protein